LAGYSGKPLVQKLGIKPGFRIFAAGAPAAYSDIVGKFCAIDEMWSGLKFVIPRDPRIKSDQQIKRWK